MKKSKLELYLFPQDGDIVFQDPQAPMKISEFLQVNDRKQVSITYEVIKEVKSYEQLKFYWGVVIPALCQATGVALRSEMDLLCRNEYLKTIKIVNGKEVVYIPTLKIHANEVDMEVMSGYIEKCLELLADSGGSIPKNAIDKYETMMEGQ